MADQYRFFSENTLKYWDEENEYWNIGSHDGNEVTGKPPKPDKPPKLESAKLRNGRVLRDPVYRFQPEPSIGPRKSNNLQKE